MILVEYLCFQLIHVSSLIFLNVHVEILIRYYNYSFSILEAVGFIRVVALNHEEVQHQTVGLTIFLFPLTRRKNRFSKPKQETVQNHRQRKGRNRCHVVPHCHPRCLWIFERVPSDRAWVQLPRHHANSFSDMHSTKWTIGCSYVLEKVDQRT